VHTQKFTLQHAKPIFLSIIRRFTAIKHTDTDTTFTKPRSRLQCRSVLLLCFPTCRQQLPLLFQFGQTLFQLVLLFNHEQVAFSHFVQNEKVRAERRQARADEKAAQALQQTGAAATALLDGGGGGVGRQASSRCELLRQQLWWWRLCVCERR